MMTERRARGQWRLYQQAMASFRPMRTQFRSIGPIFVTTAETKAGTVVPDDSPVMEDTVSTSVRQNTVTANRVGDAGRLRSQRLVLLATGDSKATYARVKVVRSFTARLVGLLGRKTLDDHDGLLLAPCGSVHTLGLRFAIDIVFVDAELTVLDVIPHVKPWRVACAPRRTCYALELRAGLAHAVGIRVGQSVAFRSERRATR
jgi:uncharacterized membrane protein (UPF0127 family)